MSAERYRPPGPLRHLLLLFGLRLRIGLNRGKRPRRALSVVAYLLSCSPAIALGLFFYRLMTWRPLVHTVWQPFILQILCFVTTCAWCIWPVLSAGVDDHSELSRYAAFPVSGFRLLSASMLSSLLEPRSVMFASPVLGAVIGLARTRDALSGRPWTWVALGLLFISYLLIDAAWSRAAVNFMLNVLKERRSAELIGGGFVLFLAVCTLIPPVDTSWLTHVGGASLGKLNASVLANAARALTLVPSGWFGAAVLLLGVAADGKAALATLGMVVVLGVGAWLAHFLLVRFYRRAGRVPTASRRFLDRDPFRRAPDRKSALWRKELLDLWRNPKARMLATVPFVLAILLRLLSARGLLVFWTGRSADGWLLGVLALYGVVVMTSTFAQNTFAYDGRGLGTFLAAPVELEEVLAAKNRVHAWAGAVLVVAVLIFYRLYFRAGSVWDLLCVALAAAALIPILVGAGNFLSLWFPVKFHASLKRRDRLPLMAAALGFAAAGVGCVPFVWVLRHAGRTGLSGSSAAVLLGWAAVAWAAYLASLPAARAALGTHRELVFHAVTRE